MLIAIVVALYGSKKFVIMATHADTQFNTYYEKNKLDTKVFHQDELDFWFAFTLFKSDYVADNDLTNIKIKSDYDNIIEFDVTLWA